MWDFIKWLLLLYVPPKPGDIDAMYRYQVAISISAVSIWAVAWLVGLWLFGAVPFFPQVAWADQIKNVQDQVDRISGEERQVINKLTAFQALQLRQAIEQQFKTSCMAARARNQADLDNANRQLNELTDQYYQIAGRPFSLPSCNTVLVDGK